MSIGKFTATATAPQGRTPAPVGVGTLNIVETLDIPPFVTPELQVAGAYEINSSCTGGTLYFDTAQQPAQFAFAFANGYTEMYLLSTSTGTNPIQNWGVAKNIPTPIVCPAGGPLSTITGNGQSFGFGFGAGTYYVPTPLAGVGTFTPSVQTVRGSSVGVLTGTLTSENYNTSPTLAAPFGGVYTVDPDCSGGTIEFDTALSVRFQFLFVNSSFSQMYIMSLDGTNSMLGVAKQF
jgi:hypothetical protein